jgi:hypothetical protein
LSTKSDKACNVLDLSKYLKWLDNLKPFYGAILAVVGIAIFLRGYDIFNAFQAIFIGFFIWFALLAVVYNLYPSGNLNLKIFCIMAGVTLILAIIIAVLVAKFLTKAIWYILVGVMCSGLVVFILGLVKMSGNGKLVSIGAIVGFIAGILIAIYYEKTRAPLQAYGFCFLGSYLFFFGVSQYLGGFNKTAWSVYVYGVLIVVSFVLRGKTSADIASSSAAKEAASSKDEMANQEEGYHGVAN